MAASRPPQLVDLSSADPAPTPCPACGLPDGMPAAPVRIDGRLARLECLACRHAEYLFLDD